MAWVLGFVGGGGVAALASGIWVLDPSPVQFLLAASATLSLPCVATIHTHPFPHNLQLHKMELPLRPWARPGGGGSCRRLDAGRGVVVVVEREGRKAEVTITGAAFLFESLSHLRPLWDVLQWAV